MKIFNFKDPKNFESYARYSHVGTWSEGQLCAECKQPTSMLIEPLKIEWEPDSAFIGDFSWCGYTAVVTENISKLLLEMGFECDFKNVLVVPPTTKPKNKKLVPYPYDGPNLKWLIPNAQIPVNEKRSGIKLKIDCPACGRKKYSFKLDNLYIDSDHWQGQKIFSIEQFARSRAMFVTEEGLSLLKIKEINNIGFSEVGIIS